MPGVALYARKSTESEDRQVLSIDSQIKELQDFAKREGLADVVVFTESKSAKTPGRESFNELMSRTSSGEFDQLVCWKLDRLARNPVDGGALIWAVEEGKIRHIHTPQRRFDNTGNDKFWMQLEFGMAKKYVDDLSDNVKRGQRAKLAQGWLPCIPPLGYLNDRATRQIIKDPDRFPLIRRMWDLLLTGNHTPYGIVRMATDKWGLRTRVYKKFGGGPLAYSGIYKIFTNPFYYGKMRYREQLYDGAHPPMVTFEEFERAQNLLRKTGQARPKAKSFAYTGLITCGECGAAITAEEKINRQGHRYVYYHCTKRKRLIKCSQRVVEVKSLEAQIVSFLESVSIPRDFRDWAIGVLGDLEKEEARSQMVLTESLKKRLTAVMRENDELLNMKLRVLLTDEQYVAKKNDLSREESRLKEALAKRPQSVSKQAEGVFNLASQAVSSFKNGTTEVRKTILRQIGSNLVLKDKTLNITAHEPFEVLQDLHLGPSSESKRFEPQSGTDTTTPNRPSAARLAKWCSAVEDVRTLCEHLHMLQ
jgi:DNA invertase Pin-like site-specific DNA recombinase